MKRLLVLASAIAIVPTGIAVADDSPSDIDHGHSFILGGGQSIVLLGGWERRVAGLAGYSSWRPEPKLARLLGDHADVVWTGYGLFHQGQDSRWDEDPTYSAGFTYGFRKSWADASGRGYATQLYWGGIWSTRTSHDLPSIVNSTPGLTFSWLRPVGAKNVNANVQWMHVSNGNTVRPNRGENFFLLSLEFLLH